MMNNNIFGGTNTINEDYMLFPYNDHYPSHSSLPFNPSSSSVNDFLIHSASYTPNNHHQFVQAPSPFSQFEFVPDYSFLPQNDAHDDNQTIPIENHHASHLLPLNNLSKNQPLEPSETITHIEDSQRISTSQDPKMKKLKKPSRTDRHSKIKTARGTRDRRMRLSVDVARELFGLQDMLGFDKASKTVEWLLTQAKPEIIKIAKTLPNHSGFSSGDESQTRPELGSMDTSSDIYELSSMWTVDDGDGNINKNDKTGNKVDGRSMRGKRKRLQPRKPILKKLSKDARAKARERAKDRTKEKMIMKRRSQVKVIDQEANPHDETEELCKNDRFAVCNEFVMNNKDPTSDESYHDVINKFNSSFPMLNHHRSQGATTSIEQRQYQFTDLNQYFLGKPRDLVYNYQGMG